jgi:hypothetical protein
MNAGQEAVRCATWAREQQLDPVGTAGSYAGFLLLELPLPWPRDVNAIQEVSGLRETLTAGRIRLQALVPHGGPRRAILYRTTGDGGFRQYAGRETGVDGDAAGAVSELLAGGGRPLPASRQDVLLCTHGRRDRCCGSLGTELAAELGLLGEDEAQPFGPDVEAWRTSHTGGHRFAPTAVVLPQATMWAYVDEGLLSQVLTRRAAPDEVADRYRGCAGLASPALQALEREIFRRVGWELFDRPRIGHDLGRGHVRLEIRRSDGGTDVWEGVVAEGRRLAVPDCGAPIEAATKSETELVVSDVSGPRPRPAPVP